MNLVIDASVLIKFFIPEILYEKAAELLQQVESGGIQLLAPDLIYAESGNILWKKCRLKELNRSQVEQISTVIENLPITVVPSKSLFHLALVIAMRYSITVYDALYLALARIHESPFLTADKKLVAALANTEWNKYVLWLGRYS